MLRVPVIKNNLNKALKIFKKKFKSTKKKLLKDKAIHKQKHLNKNNDE